MIEAFIFDMDGVIIDSEPLQLRSFNSVLSKFDIEIGMPEFKKKYMGNQDVKICEKIIADNNLPIFPEDFVAGKREAYLEILQKGDVEPIRGSVEAIQKIASKMPIAIASSSSKKEIEMITGIFGIKDLFSALVSAFEVDHGKPAPDVYLRAAELINTDPSHCGVIEDTRLGMRAAKAAGMYCVGITTTHKRDELDEADEVIDSFGELVSILSVAER